MVDNLSPLKTRKRLPGHRAVEKGVGQFLPGEGSGRNNLVGGKPALSARQLRTTAVGNYLFPAINKIILRKAREKEQLGSFMQASSISCS